MFVEIINYELWMDRSYDKQDFGALGKIEDLMQEGSKSNTK